MSQTTIEERLQSLEKEVAELKRRIDRPNGQLNWIENVSGSMADFPEFDDVVRLGREFRESQTDADESA